MKKFNKYKFQLYIFIPLFSLFVFYQLFTGSVFFGRFGNFTLEERPGLFWGFIIFYLLAIAYELFRNLHELKKLNREEQNEKE